MAMRTLTSFLLRQTISSVRPVSSVCTVPCATWSRLHLQPRTCVSQKKFSSSVPKPQKQTVTVIFIDRDGDRIETEAQVGDNLLDVAQRHDVELEGTQHRNAGLGALGCEVKVTFELRDGSRREVAAAVGDNLLDIILEHDVDIDGFGQFPAVVSLCPALVVHTQLVYRAILSR
ncbi:adrenodoxin, mitochondrial [Elysia marginata]|uniref:Adrenodoxin, mitochondrial n=1 Tax=Elysia marginata TaxID=1093978 RepID=A0AAV4JSU1_9GAST|nr:adrenodoxin, mitochondrial [Elysia marginata]